MIGVITKDCKFVFDARGTQIYIYYNQENDDFTRK